MRKLILILSLFISSLTYSQIKVGEHGITTQGLGDSTATFEPDKGYGNWHNVTDTAALRGTVIFRKVLGMWVYVVSNDSLYILSGNTLNTSYWKNVLKMGDIYSSPAFGTHVTETYAGTPVWDGTPPSTTNNFYDEWSKNTLLKVVTFTLNLKYTNQGTTNTTVVIPLAGSTLPTPQAPSGWGAVNDYSYTLSGIITNGTTNAGGNGQKAVLGLDGSGNWIITVTINASISAKAVRVQGFYFIP